MQPDLPYVDQHAVVVPASPEDVWHALLAYVDRSLAAPGPAPRRVLTRLVGTDPASGFTPHVDEPGRRLRLTGRHRFSRYALILEVGPDGAGSRLTATSFAAFPGPHGTAYRAVVLGSGAHRVLTRRMLRAVAAGSGRRRT